LKLNLGGFHCSQAVLWRFCRSSLGISIMLHNFSLPYHFGPYVIISFEAFKLSQISFCSLQNLKMFYQVLNSTFTRRHGQGQDTKNWCLVRKIQDTYVQIYINIKFFFCKKHRNKHIKGAWVVKICEPTR
jgi:hypothetical protein